MIVPLDYRLKRNLIFSSLFILVAVIYAGWMNNNSTDGLLSNLKKLILKELVAIEPPPAGGAIDVIYVLGGNKKSLELKYQTAAKLFNQGVSNNILILSHSGITDYNQLLRNNLRDNEWSLQKLEAFGVPKRVVESIETNNVFFGTLSEAESVTRLAKQRGYTNILLISQEYHSKRVILSFRKFLRHSNISVYTQCSSESQSLWGTVIEFIKLKVYIYFLL
jgi:uncharacterized SAM-binding protein YcdF (DUF218 family)